MGRKPSHGAPGSLPSPKRPFTQEDPIGIAGGLNLYGYANGDPINFSDPFGLCPVCVVAGAWALFELGSGVYDAYNAVRTVFSDASTGEKATTVALAAASLGLPGGGYSGAGRFADEAADLAKRIPGNPFRGANAPQRAFSHLEEYSGLDPNVASARLHRLKESAGLGGSDDVVIGRTGDVYNATNGEHLGTLTDRSLGGREE